MNLSHVEDHSRQQPKIEHICNSEFEDYKTYHVQQLKENIKELQSMGWDTNWEINDLLEELKSWDKPIIH